MSLTDLGGFTRMTPGNDKESSISLTSLTGATGIVVPSYRALLS